MKQKKFRKLNETKVSKLPDKEFNIMAIKMLTRLERIMDKLKTLQ